MERSWTMPRLNLPLNLQPRLSPRETMCALAVIIAEFLQQPASAVASCESRKGRVNRMTITLMINGREKTFVIDPVEKLLELLRREGYMGVKKGCGSGDCGACAILLNGRAVNSCLVFAARADGSEILTIEGLADGESLHPIQTAFLTEGAIQCGYCTPGMVISTVDLLSRNPDPTEGEIREALSGNLCRCTGYAKQVRAVQRAAELMKDGEADV